MSAYRLCYFSATAMELPSLSEGVRQYADTIGGIKVHARTQSQLFDQARKTAFVDQAMASDAIIVTLHGGKPSFPAFDDLAQRLGDVPADQRPYLHIQPTGGDEDAVEAARELSVDFGTPAWDEIQRYLNQGGHANFHQVLIYLHNRLFHTRMPCLPPTALPHEGIHHPDLPGIPTLEVYLAARVDPSKPMVGLWFYQTYWLNNNLAYIDAIIRSVESQGANVIPLDKLLEAISRGMWNAGDDMEEQLREAYLEMEGEIEDWTE
jgi:cobaltochelatase CobN